MDINGRWKRIAEAVLACMANRNGRLEECAGLADVLNGMACGIVLHRPGQQVPLFYNTAVERWTGVPFGQFGPATVLALMPRLTSSALGHLQLYGLAFGKGGGGAMSLQFGLLDSEGKERAYYGLSGRLDAEDGASPVLTVCYDVELLLDATTDEDGLLEALTPERSKAFSSLTEREKEVLALVAEELGRKEIADRLFIEPQTVKTHVKNLKRKLGVGKTLGLTPYLPMVATIAIAMGIPQRGRKPM